MIATVLFLALSSMFCHFSHLTPSFTRWFDENPTAGFIINALFLGLITFEMSAYLSRIAWSNRLQLLAFLPTVALFFTHAHINYIYEGSIGVFLMLICLNLRQKIENKYIRRIYTIAATLILYWISGPIAMLFALTILVSRFSPFAFFPFTICYLLAGLSLKSNPQDDLMHLLSPYGFFTTDKDINPAIVWMPWLIWLAILSAGLYIRHYKIPQWITKHLTSIQAILLASYAIIGSMVFID